MDDAQNLLRNLSRHRPPVPRPPQIRPEVALSCWHCGATLKIPRPKTRLPCACGGAFAEAAMFEEETMDE